MRKKSRKLYLPAVMFFVLFVVFVDVPSAITQESSPTPYTEKQILILIGPHYGLPMLEAITPAIVNTLKNNGFSLDDIFVEFLDLHRHPGPQHRSNILALLEYKLKDSSIGLIIAVNQGAVDFVAGEGKYLLPGVPMLIPILERLPEWKSEPRRLITLESRQDAEGTLRYALGLFPETEQVVLIMGKDDHEAPFLAPILKALDDLPSKLHIERTADLSHEEMLARVTSLPRDAIAFYGSYFDDITGRSFVPAEVARRVATAANRPVFAFRDMHIFQGLAGGSVTITSELGKKAALIGLDYLSGNLRLVEPITTFKVPNFPLFDWRQIKRWGGDPSKLPAGTVFLNRPHTLWSQYREAVIIALASFVLLFFLVVALLVANGRQRVAIRKREQAEKELMESEALLSRSQEVAHIGSWKLDLTANKLYWSDEVYRIFGCKPQEFVATYEAFLDFVHPDDRAPVNEAYSSSLREGTDSYEIEHRIVRKGTDEVRHVHERCVHVRDDAGAIIQSIGTVQDITERKKARERILELNNRLQHLTQVIQQLSLANSLQEISEAVRTEARKLIEADGVTFVLRDDNQCFYMDEDAISPLWKGRRFPLEACISGWAMLHRETVVIEDIYKDDRIPYDVYRPTFVKSLAMIPINTEDPCGAIGIYWARQNRPGEDEMLLIHTLANATAIAMENIRSYKELERRIEKRTNELTRANLRLQELDRLKSMFIASMSHELRTPLNSIIGFTGIILMGMSGPLSDNQRKQLGMVKKSAHHLLDLINDVIDVSKIEAGKAELIIEDFDIVDLALDVKESFSVAAKDKGLSLELNGGHKITVSSDQRRVRQILMNLVGNAVKFTETGGVSVHVRYAAEDLHGSVPAEQEREVSFSEYVQVTVSDTGVGISTDGLARLFDAFSRIHIQGRPVVEGSGLGLYLSRRIAELLGGRIEVKSAPGQGSVFILTLPRIPQERKN